MFQIHIYISITLFLKFPKKTHKLCYSIELKCLGYNVTEDTDLLEEVVDVIMQDRKFVENMFTRLVPILINAMSAENEDKSNYISRRKRAIQRRSVNQHKIHNHLKSHSRQG